MNMMLRQRAEIERIKSEIANQYGAAAFEDIDRGEMTSRENGDITRTLVALAEETLNR
ncbi:MAG: small, acid-soluble spore protein, alpha/beta type [Eubacteriales bacterium]|nr:small, acid-soluble spore protein, alpha/beta type [Eubacteriales bacterium]